MGGGSGRVDTVGLDGNDDGSTVFQKVVSVQSDNSSLIRLSDICEDDIYHLDQHSVFLRVSSVLYNRNDVCSFLGHTDEISSGSVRELDGVDDSFGTYNVGNVGDGRTGGGSEVKNFCSWFDLP